MQQGTKELFSCWRWWKRMTKVDNENLFVCLGHISRIEWHWGPWRLRVDSPSSWHCRKNLSGPCCDNESCGWRKTTKKCPKISFTWSWYKYLQEANSVISSYRLFEMTALPRRTCTWGSCCKVVFFSPYLYIGTGLPSAKWKCNDLPPRMSSPPWRYCLRTWSAYFRTESLIDQRKTKALDTAGNWILYRNWNRTENALVWEANLQPHLQNEQGHHFKSTPLLNNNWELELVDLAVVVWIHWTEPNRENE